MEQSSENQTTVTFSTQETSTRLQQSLKYTGRVSTSHEYMSLYWH